MLIREMKEADIPSVMLIDESAFGKPWSEKSFREEIEKDYSHYIVAEKDGAPVGYAGIWCIYETAELIRIATAADFLRCGIADMMMNVLFELAEGAECERMMLEVRESNFGAKKLYLKHGFSEISVRKGYYDGENAIIMEAAVK